MGYCHSPEANSPQTIPAVALDSLVHYFSFMAETYKINPDNIRGHRDFNSTSCPGDNNYKLLSEIRTRVKNVLLTPNDREKPLPETSILEAIYPNPATIRTNIRFYVQETGLTDLTLYDAQGRRVAWIANDIRFGRTWYEEPVLLSGLPNGTYFLVLTTHSGKNEPTHKTQPLIVAR